MSKNRNQSTTVRAEDGAGQSARAQPAPTCSDTALYVADHPSRREPPSEATQRADEEIAQVLDAIDTASKVMRHFHNYGWPDFEGAREKLNKARAVVARQV